MDVIDAIAKTRHAFLYAGLEAPKAILLSSHEQGMAFLMAVHQLQSLTIPNGSERAGKPVVMNDGSTWMELTIMNVKVCWPAMAYPMPDGSTHYV